MDDLDKLTDFSYSTSITIVIGPLSNTLGGAMESVTLTREVVSFADLRKRRPKSVKALTDGAAADSVEMPEDRQSKVMPKRYSRDWIKYGRIAEWMAVKEGRTLDEIRSSPDVPVGLPTLMSWSTQHHWQEKRQQYIRRPTTIPTLIHDILFGSLMKAHHRQIGGIDLTLDEVSGLDKLLRMYKTTGVPFHEQAGLVMREFLRYATEQLKGTKELTYVLDIVEAFSRKVENGMIQPATDLS